MLYAVLGFGRFLIDDPAPVMSGGGDCLKLRRAALRAGVGLYAVRLAGRSGCDLALVPSMRAGRLLFGLAAVLALAVLTVVVLAGRGDDLGLNNAFSERVYARSVSLSNCA